MNTLDKNLLGLIGQKLNFKDIYNLVLTCKYLNKSYETEIFWRNFIIEKTGMVYKNPIKTIQSIHINPQNWINLALEKKKDDLLHFVLTNFKSYMPVIGIFDIEKYIENILNPDVINIYDYIKITSQIIRYEKFRNVKDIYGKEKLTLIMFQAHALYINYDIFYPDLNVFYNSLKIKIINRLFELKQIYRVGESNPFYS